MKYAVVIEKGPESFGAYAPDLPGCAVAGETREEVVQLIPEAIEIHLQSWKSTEMRFRRQRLHLNLWMLLLNCKKWGGVH